MSKIAKVIETCNDCVWCELFVSVDSNYSSVIICTHDENENGSFLINHSETDANVKDRFVNTIPKNCPLEDYKK